MNTSFTTVELQSPFHYSIWTILIIALLFIGLTICLVYEFIKKHQRSVDLQRPVVQKRTPTQVNSIRAKYLKELNNIENDFDNNKISLRHAYQKLSKTVRKFVYEMTGIRVDNFTLQDIKEAGVPYLVELISECYAPEFSKYSSGNLKESLNKAKRIIEQWA